ncbi:MAG: DegT/DnrJ/EryC1/StrS family aminotransferase, partial [Burkholderiales bacterium]|nr:DegT/DnrJ/EryC1/StrS family aminotransferase [Burkholderiales bacterium]
PAKAYKGDDAGHSWNMFCVLLPLLELSITRKQFMDAMHVQQIGIGVSYEAMHLSSLFRSKGHVTGEFPNAERIAAETVTLPLHPGMTNADVERVCTSMCDILSTHRRTP